MSPTLGVPADARIEQAPMHQQREADEAGDRPASPPTAMASNCLKPG